MVMEVVDVVSDQTGPDRPLAALGGSRPIPGPTSPSSVAEEPSKGISCRPVEI